MFFRECQLLLNYIASKGTQRVRHREDESFEILAGKIDRNPLHGKDEDGLKYPMLISVKCTCHLEFECSHY